MKELELEQDVAAEIENCDQDYLSELRATLEEQGYCLALIARCGTTANAGESSAVLDERRAEVSEAKAKLERLEEKVRDIETANTETMVSIEALQQTLHVRENSNYSEALRLKGTRSLPSEQGPRRCKSFNLLGFIRRRTRRVGTTAPLANYQGKAGCLRISLRLSLPRPRPLHQVQTQEGSHSDHKNERDHL